MKNKKIYITTFLFSLLLLVGFSPPSSNENINKIISHNIVYADNTGYKDSAFVTSIKNYITNNDLSGLNTEQINTLTKNLDDSIGTFNKYMDTIINALKSTITALTILSIAWIGFSYMTTGSGNLLAFIKGREKISNLCLAIVFAFAIPLFIDAINSLTVKNVSSDANSPMYELAEEGTGTKMSDIFVTPTSNVKDMIKEYASSEATNEDSSLLGESLKSSSQNGILRVIENILMFMLKFIYTPFHFVISLFGVIGFYPMSFDPGLYSTDMVSTVLSQFSAFKEGVYEGIWQIDSMGDVASGIAASVSKSFGMVIVVINLIAGIIKKFCMASINLACYYYAFRVMTGIESVKVKDFLTRLLQGVLGMFSAPLIMQTLLDIDAMISTAIISMAGKSVPGMGMMNLIMTPKEATSNTINFIFAAGMLAVMFFISQAFLFRRLELIMYYLLSAPIFFKHIFSPSSEIVGHWFKTVSSAAFVTTTYSPLFVLVQFLIIFGVAINDAGFGGLVNRLIYYAIVWFIIFKGKELVLLAVDLLFGGRSASDSFMRRKTLEGLDYAQNLPTNTGRLIGGITGGAIGMAMGAKDAIKTEAGNLEGKSGWAKAGALAWGATKAGAKSMTHTAVGSIRDSMAQGFAEELLDKRRNSAYQQSVDSGLKRHELMDSTGITASSKIKNGFVDGFQADLAERKDTLSRQTRDEWRARGATAGAMIETSKNAFGQLAKGNVKGAFGTILNKEEFQKNVANRFNQGLSDKNVKDLVDKGIPEMDKMGTSLIHAIEDGFSSDAVNKAMTNMIARGLDKSNPEARDMLKEIVTAKKDFDTHQKAFETASKNKDVYGMAKALEGMNKSSDILSNAQYAIDLSKSLSTVVDASKASEGISTLDGYNTLIKTNVKAIQAMNSIETSKLNSSTLSSRDTVTSIASSTTNVAHMSQRKRAEFIEAYETMSGQKLTDKDKSVDGLAKLMKDIKNNNDKHVTTVNDAEIKFNENFENLTGVKVSGSATTIMKEIETGTNANYNVARSKAKQEEAQFNKIYVDMGGKNSNSLDISGLQDNIIKGLDKNIVNAVANAAADSKVGNYNVNISKIENIKDAGTLISTFNGSVDDIMKKLDNENDRREIVHKIERVTGTDMNNASNNDIIKFMQNNNTALDKKLDGMIKEAGLENKTEIKNNITSGNTDVINKTIFNMVSSEKVINSTANLDKTIKKSLENAYQQSKAQTTTAMSNMEATKQKMAKSEYMDKKMEKIINAVGKEAYYKVNTVTEVKNGVTYKFATDSNGKEILNSKGERIELVYNDEKKGRVVDYHAKEMAKIANYAKAKSNATPTKPNATSSNNGYKNSDMDKAIKQSVAESFMGEYMNHGHFDGDDFE